MRALYFTDGNLGRIFMILFSKFIRILPIEYILTKAKFTDENFSDVTVNVVCLGLIMFPVCVVRCHITYICLVLITMLLTTIYEDALGIPA